MIVRRCELGDLPDVVGLAAEFHAESVQHHFLAFDPVKVHELVVTAIANDDWLPLVAYASGGQLVGIGLFFVLPSFFGPDLEGGDLVFYVKPDRRGSIAAAGILKQLVPWLGRKGVTVYRQGVNTGIDDARAEQFFARCGFERTGSIWSLRP